MAKRGGFPGGGGGGGNMGNMMKQFQKMQKDVEKVQEQLGDMTVEATSGGGAVKVIVTGNKEIRDIELKPEIVDPDDIEMLKDLIIAAVNEGIRKAEDMSNNEMAKVTGAGGIPGMF